MVCNGWSHTSLYMLYGIIPWIAGSPSLYLVLRIGMVFMFVYYFASRSSIPSKWSWLWAGDQADNIYIFFYSRRGNTNSNTSIVPQKEYFSENRTSMKKSLRSGARRCKCVEFNKFFNRRRIMLDYINTCIYTSDDTNTKKTPKSHKIFGKVNNCRRIATFKRRMSRAHSIESAASCAQ